MLVYPLNLYKAGEVTIRVHSDADRDAKLAEGWSRVPVELQTAPTLPEGESVDAERPPADDVDQVAPRTVADLVAVLPDIYDLELLQRWRDTEEAAKNRPTALEAIDGRIAELDSQ